MAKLLTLLELEARITPADLRVVTYNITAADGTVRAGLVAPTISDFGILDTIGKQNVGGLLRPVDVLLLQETDTGFTAINTVASQLNTYYGAGAYSAVQVAGGTVGGGTQGIVYRNSTIDYLATATVGDFGGSNAPRQTLRHQLRLDGTTTELYIYNSHLKADTNSGDATKRLAEVQAIRASADLLPATANILYVGDYNFYASGASEPAYAQFLAAGNGQAQDVANPTGNWVRNSNAWDGLYTQAPLNNPGPGLTGGGLDDRFDFILTSTELSDGSGLEYRANSYRTFGNDGSLTANTDINVPSNTALNNTPLNSSQRQGVLNLLTTVSDHLPVVADFTFPSGPTAVTGYTINGGGQRSRVSTVSVTFNAPVPSQLTAANFPINGFTGTRNVTHTPGSAIAFITFSGSSVEFGSLADGLYTLAVNLPGVSNNLFAFHRLFGDVNGDRTVSAVDFAAFGSVFGVTLTGSAFDFDFNGTIDSSDFAQFGSRFGITL